jgi:hypothetical protein
MRTSREKETKRMLQFLTGVYRKIEEGESSFSMDGLCRYYRVSRATGVVLRKLNLIEDKGFKNQPNYKWMGGKPNLMMVKKVRIALNKYSNSPIKKIANGIELKGNEKADTAEKLTLNLSDEYPISSPLKESNLYLPQMMFKAEKEIMANVATQVTGYKITPELLESRTRKKEVVIARHVLMKIMYDEGMSLSAVGAAFGNHHVNVIYARKIVERDLEADCQPMKQIYEMCKQRVVEYNNRDAHKTTEKKTRQTQVGDLFSSADLEVIKEEKVPFFSLKIGRLKISF